MRKTMQLGLVALCGVVVCSTAVFAQMLSLDHTDGLYGPGKLLTNQTVVFHIRVSSDGEHAYGSIDNAFKVFSPDGAEWGQTFMDTTGVYGAEDFDLVFVVNHIDADGIGSDTAGAGGVVFDSPYGFGPDFDTVAYTITIGPIPDIHDRKTICLDSAWYPPSGRRWNWGYRENGVHQVLPGWNGPHCFEIVDPCCQNRGDTDHSGGPPDISDLVYLVTFMFNGGPQPPCPEETDVNGDWSDHDISDLVYLVTYMFSGGPPPVACP